MATRPLEHQPGSERIPFYRNVKVIGMLAQSIFALIVIATVIVLYLNVTTALERSNLPADFSFLDNRAGIPIAESTIRYSPDDPYWRAYLIGFLNTLKVALVGVIFASLLGVLVGVMRLSSNWLVRQLATAYVETIRNTPLAVQIIFWFTAVLTTLPPRISNPVEVPGGIFISNSGVALPWLYPTYRFSAWLPWLAAAVLVLLVGFGLLRRRFEKAERPGNPWLLPLGLALAVAGVGYWLSSAGSSLPENVTTDFRADRGRGTVFIDENDNGRFDRGERSVPFAQVVVSVPEGRLGTSLQNLIESRRAVNSTFRFPTLLEREFESAEVAFADPQDAERFSLHFVSFPSAGVVYRDRDGNGAYGPGEEIDEATGRGFSGVRLELLVTGFERRLVADRDGQVRIPRFEAVTEAAATSESPAARSPSNLFGQPATAGDEGELEAATTIQPTGPLVLSNPTIPVSNYEGGVTLSTSYLALLLALVIYTASFIAEIVRGGVQAVPRGQREAARALGLSSYHTFQLVVFPQALRIIMPPMISQYLNLTKNSSLAPLAAYVELFAISAIIANQTGASVPVIVMLIGAYLLISLTFAFVLNIVNARMALVER